jgi:hypothetical protein
MPGHATAPVPRPAAPARPWAALPRVPGEQSSESLYVDRVPRHLQHVTGCPRDDDGRGRSQGMAQPRGVGLQRIASLLGRLLAEHLVNQPVERDDGAAAEQERGEQRPLPRPWHRDELARHPDLERPQDAELHLALQPGHPRTLHRHAHRRRQRSRRARYRVKRVIGRKLFRSAPWRHMPLNRLRDGSPQGRQALGKVAYSRRTPTVRDLYAIGTTLRARAARTGARQRQRRTHAIPYRHRRAQGARRAADR